MQPGSVSKYWTLQLCWQNCFVNEIVVIILDINIINLSTPAYCKLFPLSVSHSSLSNVCNVLQTDDQFAKLNNLQRRDPTKRFPNGANSSLLCLDNRAITLNSKEKQVSIINTNDKRATSSNCKGQRNKTAAWNTKAKQIPLFHCFPTDLHLFPPELFHHNRRHYGRPPHATSVDTTRTRTVKLQWEDTLEDSQKCPDVGGVSSSEV